MERACEGVITFEYICTYIDFFLNLGLLSLDFDSISHPMMLITYVNEGKTAFYHFFFKHFYACRKCTVFCLNRHEEIFHSTFTEKPLRFTSVHHTDINMMS